MAAPAPSAALSAVPSTVSLSKHQPLLPPPSSSSPLPPPPPPPPQAPPIPAEIAFRVVRADAPGKDRVRLQIILSIVLLALCLLPLGFESTRVQRASLPYAQVAHWNRAEALRVDWPITIHVDLFDAPAAGAAAEAAWHRPRAQALSDRINAIMERDARAPDEGVDRRTPHAAAASDDGHADAKHADAGPPIDGRLRVAVAITPQRAAAADVAAAAAAPIDADGSVGTQPVWQAARAVRPALGNLDYAFAVFVVPDAAPLQAPQVAVWPDKRVTLVVSASYMPPPRASEPWTPDSTTWLDHVLVRTAASLFRDEHADLSGRYQQLFPQEADRRLMRALPYTTEYHITFTLLIGARPPSASASGSAVDGSSGSPPPSGGGAEPTQDHLAENSTAVASSSSSASAAADANARWHRFLKQPWDIDDAIAQSIEPLLNVTRHFSHVEVESQVVSYASLSPAARLEQTMLHTMPVWILRPTQLPQFVNTGEWPLSSLSLQTNGASVNLMLYIPPPEACPLFVLTSQSEVSETGAFVLPRYGGVVVSNVLCAPLAAHDHRPLPDRLDAATLAPVMQRFARQLETLLGFPAQNVTQALQTNLPAEVSIIDLTRATAQQVSLWQTDRYARRTVLECMKAAAGTLASLVKLVSSLENMVVLESIQRQVEDAIAALDAAWTDLHRADPDVPRAFESARTAVFRAEQAFFDPTMVALLYFPDEHKYAVFVPLFVPISVPLLISLVREIKRRRDLARRRRLALAYEKAQRAAREHPGAGADADATAEAPAPPAPSMS